MEGFETYQYAKIFTEMKTYGNHMENNCNIHQMEPPNDVQLGTGLFKKML